MVVRPLSDSAAARPLTAPTTAAAAHPGGLHPRLRDAARLRRYQRMLDVYEGRHPTADRRAGGRPELVLNYAKPVVDKGVAYLLGRGLGFSVPPRRQSSRRDRDRAARAEQLLYDVYWDNDLAATDLQVAQNAGVLGDGVYKVWYDVLAKQIRVACVDPFGFFARFAGDDPSRIVQAEAAYALGPDELVTGGYVADAATAAALVGPEGSSGALRPAADVLETWTATHLTVLVGDREIRRSANPYGQIPFVHVPNMQPANRAWGVSDLADVVGINAELNARVSDQAETIRYHADPPVVFKGVTDHSDLAVGPGTIWDVPSDATVELLEWRGQAPAVGEHIERVMRALYEVSETPRTAFGDSGRMLSGVALETELRPLIQKTLRRQVFWTRALRRRNALILQLAEQFGLGGARPGDYAPYRTTIVWPPMVPSDDTADVRNQVSLVAAGLRAHSTAMDALGVESPEREIERILEDRAALGTADAPSAPADATAAGNPTEPGAQSDDAR